MSLRTSRGCEDSLCGRTRRVVRRFGACALVAAGVLAGSGYPHSVNAQDTAAAPAATTNDTGAGKAPVAVTVELNKLEEVDKGCRVYFVISNKTPKAFQTFKIDLILFRTDGVIGKRVFADIAPLRADRARQVKLFDLSGIKCAEVGSLLVNDTLECRDDEGVVEQCFSRLEVSSLGNVTLSK